MRIWCQSTSVMGGKDEVSSLYDQSLRRHIRRVVRPDTTVDLYGVDFTIPGTGHYRASRPIAQTQLVRNAIRAQEQGYDAFIELNTNDIGPQEIRELVQIPVIFITETSLYLACLLADKFAFLTHNETMLNRITEVTERYGIRERLVAGGHLECDDYRELMDMFRNPEKYIDSIAKVVKEIASRGANLILSSGLQLNQWFVDNKIQNIDGVTIFDLTGAALKMAELMVDLKVLGISRSPRYFNSPPSETMAALKKVYGV